MATRPYTVDSSMSRGGATKCVTWTGLLNGDTGAPIQLSEWSEKTFQTFGTFGAGGTVVIEGSNEATNPTNWSPISNRQGTTPFAMSSTTQINTSQDRPIWIRPRVSAGDGTTSLTVAMAAHRFNIAENQA